MDRRICPTNCATQQKIPMAIPRYGDKHKVNINQKSKSRDFMKRFVGDRLKEQKRIPMVGS
jgi:hypothetical protein